MGSTIGSLIGKMLHIPFFCFLLENRNVRMPGPSSESYPTQVFFCLDNPMDNDGAYGSIVIHWNWSCTVVGIVSPPARTCHWPETEKALLQNDYRFEVDISETWQSSSEILSHLMNITLSKLHWICPINATSLIEHCIYNWPCDMDGNSYGWTLAVGKGTPRTNRDLREEDTKPRDQCDQDENPSYKIFDQRNQCRWANTRRVNLCTRNWRSSPKSSVKGIAITGMWTAIRIPRVRRRRFARTEALA